jgi:hypothetical protein
MPEDKVGGLVAASPPSRRRYPTKDPRRQFMGEPTVRLDAQPPQVARWRSVADCDADPLELARLLEQQAGPRMEQHSQVLVAISGPAPSRDVVAHLLEAALEEYNSGPWGDSLSGGGPAPQVSIREARSDPHLIGFSWLELEVVEFHEESADV